MNFFILTGNKNTADSLQRFVTHIFSACSPEFSFGYLGRPETIVPQDWRDAEILIAEAFSLEHPDNPEGWRTAKKSQKKALVLFTYPIKEMRQDVFFIASSILDLESKLENVIKMSRATQKDYICLEDQYPVLMNLPLHHHGK